MTFDLPNAIAILERTPAALDRLLRGLPEAWTAPNEGPQTWSAFDVVGHLIDGEETDWIPRARIILGAGPDRHFIPFDRFRHLTRNWGRPLDDLLDEFAGLRRANLVTLREFRLTPADLARTGVHPEFGTVTLEQLLATWTVHDLNHLTQIARVMAVQYDAAVGPWRAYLSVLQGKR
jgi:hypothetical protein